MKKTFDFLKYKTEYGDTIQYSCPASAWITPRLLNLCITKDDLTRVVNVDIDYHEEFVKSPLKRKSGALISAVGKSAIAKRNYNKFAYNNFCEIKYDVLYKNDPRSNKLMFIQYLYRKFGIKNGKYYIPYVIDIHNLDFYAENNYRIQIDTCHLLSIGEDLEDRLDYIRTVEEKNSDFLNNTKYLLTPSVINLLKNVPNINYKLPRSQIIAIAKAKNNRDENKFDKLINMTEKQFKDLKKKTEKKYQMKFDFRKSKEINTFIRYME